MVDITTRDFAEDNNEQQYVFGRPVDSKEKKYVFGMTNTIGSPFVWDPSTLQNQSNEGQKSTQAELAATNTLKEGQQNQEVKSLSKIAIAETDNAFIDQASHLGKILDKNQENKGADELAKPKEVEGTTRARFEAKSELVKQLTPEVVASLKADLKEPVEAELREELKTDVRSKLVVQLTPEIKASLRAELEISVREELRKEWKAEVYAAREQIASMCEAETRTELREELIPEVKAQLREELREEVRDNLAGELSDFQDRTKSDLLEKAEKALGEGLEDEVWHKINEIVITHYTYKFGRANGKKLTPMDKAKNELYTILEEVLKKDLVEIIGPRIGESLFLHYASKLDIPFGVQLAEGAEKMFLKDEQDSQHEQDSVYGNDADKYSSSSGGEDHDLAKKPARSHLQQRPHHQGKERSRSPERRNTYRQTRDRSRSPIRHDKHRKHSGHYRSRTPEDAYRHRNYHDMSSDGEDHKPGCTNANDETSRRSPTDEEHSYAEDKVDYAKHASRKHTTSPTYKEGVDYVRYSGFVMGMTQKAETPHSPPPHGFKRSRFEQEYDEDDYLGRYAKRARGPRDEAYGRISLGDDPRNFEESEQTEESGESGEDQEEEEEEDEEEEEL